VQPRRFLALVAFVLLAHPALAAKTGWVATESLNVRKGPSTEADRLTSAKRGQKLTVTAFRDDRWCRVQLSSGSTGWVREEYLTFAKPSGASAGSAGSSGGATAGWVEPAVINVREKPDIGAGLVRQLPQGTKLFVTARDGAWRKVHTLGGTSGWVRVDLLTFDASQGRTLAGAATPAQPTTRPAWISANVANVRNGPSAGYSRIGQFTRGAKVYILAHRDEWVRVKSSNGSGWVHADLLETDVSRGRRLATSSSDRDKAYCVGTVVNLRKGPGTSHHDLGEVRQGTTLWIKGEQNGWCKVLAQDGRTGWVAGWYVRRHAARTTVAPEPGTRAPQVYMTRYPAATRRPHRTAIQPFKAWIAEDHTNIRYGPSVERDVKFQLDRRAAVMVIDTEGQWCKIQSDSGNTGWAAGWVLDFQPPGEPEAAVKVNGEKEEAKAGWVNRPTANIRASADGDSQVLATADVGTEIVITDRQGEWYKVALSNGTTGWVNSDLIETRAERAASTDSAAGVTDSGSSRGREVVREAMKHLGASYVRGASGSGAFDCSGFTSYVYRQFGVHLARTTTGQYLQGRPVSRDDLQPGDVVVFRNTYRAGISHVGLYVGQGRFIHASNSRSGVKISDLDSSYYAQRYAGSRRMF
jgi:uncharacterized protein YgiM (DUF1202 family)